MTNSLVPGGAPVGDPNFPVSRQQSQLGPHAGYGYANDVVDEDVIDLRKYWQVLVRRRWAVILVILIALISSVIITFLTTPIYRGTLLLQIERESGKVVEYQSLTPDESFNAKDFYQTQYELLQSRTLALRVIDQLGLQSSSTFSKSEEPSLLKELLAGARSLFSDEEMQGAADDQDLVEIFLENFIVSPVKNSRLVRLNYDSPDPEEAAAIVNAVAENFVNTTLERRYAATSYAQTFLEERIEQARANLEDSEMVLIEYARAREIINLDDKLDILMTKFKEMSKELIAAESGRIEAEATHQQILNEGGAGRMSDAIANPLVQKLKERKAELDAEYQEKLKIFKPGYPKMQQLQNQIAELDRKIGAESSSIGNAARTTYEARLRQEAKLTQRIGEIKAEILALQDRSTDYQTLKREADTNRELYDGLLQRMKEVGVVAGIGTNNISIVDPASIPQKKHKPSLKKNVAVALAVGLFGGILLAFLLETLDDTVKSADEFEGILMAPALAIIPHAGTSGGARDSESSGVGLLSFDDPKSSVAESIRSLRTSLIFSTSEGAPSILHIASSGPSEGKTTVAINLAIAIAQSGSTALLIDCDLRNPSIHKVFQLPNTEGLTNCLAGDASPADIAKPSQINRLFVVPSGPIPPNPVDLLASTKMRNLLSTAEERFDFVVLDGPPVLGLADALVLADAAKASLFVASKGEARVAAVTGSVKRLRSANANLLGGVLVSRKRSATTFETYHADYHYQYSYGPAADQAEPAEAARS